MQNSSSLSRSILAASVAALSFAGCSANGSQFNPAAAPLQTVTSPNAVKVHHDLELPPHSSSGVGGCIVTYFYNPVTGVWEVDYSPPGCDPAEGVIRGFDYDNTNQHFLVGQSTGSENSIAIENSKGKQLGVLTGLTGSPVGIAVDSTGVVWATNYPSNVISEYSDGATKPTATYTDGNLSSMRYVAIDQGNHVYVSGQSTGSGGLEVDELQGSAFTPIQTITGAVGAGIAVSPKTRTLWVCDEGDGSSGTISAYAMPGFKKRMQIAYSGDETGIAVGASGKELYALDNAPYGSEYNVSVIVYDTKTGKAVNSTPSITTAAKALGISSHK